VRFTLGRFCHQEVGKHMPCAYVLLSWLSPSGVSLISQRQFMPRVKLYGTRLGDRFNALYASCASLSAPYPLPIRSLSAPYPLPIRSLSAPYPLPIHSRSTPYPLPICPLSAPYPLPLQLAWRRKAQHKSLWIPPFIFFMHQITRQADSIVTLWRMEIP